MYLTDICIRNFGPIDNCDIFPQFDSGGNPKPVILVGANGSGKTMLLSSITEAFFKMAIPLFSDIAKMEGNTHPMFRVCGTANQAVGKAYSLCLLKFSIENSDMQYIERTGVLDKEKETALASRFPKLTGQSQSKKPFEKEIHRIERQLIEDTFIRKTFCFFPATRTAVPHWQNLELSPEPEHFNFQERYKGQLRKKIIESDSTTENLKWILDIILDSRLDVELVDNELKTIQNESEIQTHLFFGQARKNIESVLKKILQNDNSSLKIGYRGKGKRIYINLGEGKILPGISHLSLGQLVLFNLFCTIVRHTDAVDLHKGSQLKEIEGIVVIDEIETHLHETLRFEVLPDLILMFPKVQFIITTHSPSFVLGLKKKLGSSGFSLIDMPEGCQITTERYSDFQKSLRYLQDTEEFESFLIKQINKKHKPIVLTEGDTDPNYIRCALEVLGRKDLLEALDIDWIGAYDKSENPYNTGFTALNSASKLFQANPMMMQRFVMLLYDCDTQKKDINRTDYLFERVLPHNIKNKILKKGIENLLPDSAVGEDDYDINTKEKDYGGTVTNKDLNKRRFCERICQEKKKENFEGFNVVVEIFDELLGFSK